MNIGEKSVINGVNVAYGLSWESSKSGKCFVEIGTPQGKTYGCGDKSLDNCVSLAGYLSQENQDGIFLWEIPDSSKWVVVGVTSGILVPGSDSVVDNSSLLSSIEEMREFVDGKIYVIGDGVPDISFENYDASNIEAGEVLKSEKVNVKLILIVGFVVLAICGKFGYDQYKEQQAEILAEQARIAAAAAEAQRVKKIESDIWYLSEVNTPLNNKELVASIFKIKKKYKGWTLTTFDYPSNKGIFKKGKRAYLEDIANHFGKDVTWDDVGESAVVSFKGIENDENYKFNQEKEVFMNSFDGKVYDISLLQKLNVLGYKTAFKDTPPEWAVSLPVLPSKYYTMFLRVGGDIYKLPSILSSLDKFGMVVGRINIELDKGAFTLEVMHYMKN